MPVSAAAAVTGTGAAVNSADVIGAFVEAMVTVGLTPKGRIVPDGRLHSVTFRGDSRATGYYVLHLDGARPAGAFGCHKRGVKQTWAFRGATLTSGELRALAAKAEAARRRYEENRQRRHEGAQADANQIWSESAPAPPAHPYLVRKGVQPHGTRVDRQGRLVVPMRDLEGVLWSLQTIAADGGKLFLTSGRKKGLFFALGQLGDRLVIAEGFATAASLREATGATVIVAFDAGNLLPVAEGLRAALPRAQLVIAADDDRETRAPIENPGVHHARRAAAAVRAGLAVPVFQDPDGRTDFNDLHLAEGLDAVRAIVDAAWPEPIPEPEASAEGMEAAADAAMAGQQAEAEAATEPDDGRQRIKLAAKWINDTARQCARLLDADLYMRGSVPAILVRVENPAREEDEEIVRHGVRHARGSLIFADPAPERLMFRLDEQVLFLRHDGRSKKWGETSCPVAIARRLIGAAAELGFRPCAGIAHVPLFIKGQIVARSGYHAARGVYLDVPSDLPALPDTPTRADALRALDVLLRPFRGYLEGRGPADALRLRCGVSAAALTAVLRASLPTAPAVLLDADVAGAGKGKAARALAVIATGRLPALVTEGHAEEEMEKRLAAAILSGAPAVLLDNLQRALASSTLESTLTEGIATIRLFGKLVDVTMPWAAFVVITANNAALRSDMLRRTLPIRIVAGTDKPELRHFTFDPYEEARRSRSEIVTAGLTIARAWWFARETDEGRRIRETTLGSFEAWADLVAGAVEWLTGMNPVTLIEERKAEDPGRGAERQVIEALAQLFEDSEFTAKEAVGAPAEGDRPASGLHPELWAEVMPFKGDRPSPKQVGKWLSARRDRVFGDRQLVCRLDRKGTARWRVPGLPGFAGSASTSRAEMAGTEEMAGSENAKESGTNKPHQGREQTRPKPANPASEPRFEGVL
jgi:phage/plasmid primase-like uncharacterized protein